jgi:hypothetical protein
MNDRLEIASKVLAGLVANPNSRISGPNIPGSDYPTDWEIMQRAYAFARAIVALEKENNTTPDDDTAKKARAWGIVSREHCRPGGQVWIRGTWEEAPCEPSPLLAAVLALDKEAHGE